MEKATRESSGGDFGVRKRSRREAFAVTLSAMLLHWRVIGWGLACSLTLAAQAEDWPHALGPRYDLHSAERGLQLLFPESGPRLLWEVERGRGHAGPVVAKGRVVFLHQVDSREQIRCLEADTGRELWHYDYPVEVSENFGVLDEPHASPVIDPESGLVYTLGNDGDLHCLRLDMGSLVWKVSLPEKFGPSPSFFGYGTSPLVHGDQLFVHVGAPGACVVAFDKFTGELRWEAAHDWGGSYASPILTELHGQMRLLVFAAGRLDPPRGGLLCVNPESGAIESEFPWRSDNFASVHGASPVACGENRVFISEDFGLGGVMLEFDERFQPQVLWDDPMFGCRSQTPLFDGGLLYGCGGNGGLLMACDVRSGRVFWHEAFYRTTIPWKGRPVPISLGRAHLIHVDRKFLCLTEDGALMTMELNAGGYRILAQTRLHYAPETWAPPALSEGRLYVNQNEMGSYLRCYDLRVAAEGGAPAAPGSSN